MADTNSKQPLILIDGSSWLFRAYHVLPPLTNSQGEPTGAIYGMTNMLNKFMRDYPDESIVVVFDPPGPTFRSDMFADYKAHRPPVPEELIAQFDGLWAVIQSLGLPLVQVGGVEADDVIGTLAKQAESEVLIVTGDKDMAQLVDDRVKLLDTMQDRTTDVAEVHNKFGVGPERIADYLALVGDTSDNIPGVAKVGPKTATKWLAHYDSLDGVIAAADDIKGKVADNLRAAVDDLPLYKDLATIRCELDLSEENLDLTRREIDSERFEALCQTYDMRRFLRTESNSAARDDASPDNAEPETSSNAIYHTVLDAAALGRLRDALATAKLICVDTETDALSAMTSNLVGLSFAVTVDEAWYLPLAHDYPGAPDQLALERVQAELGPILADATIAKLGQHIKYDVNVLRRHGLPLAGVAHDTMLASYVLNSTATRHDMDSLARTYLNRATTKFETVAGKGVKQLTFNQIDLETAAPYAAEDAEITLRLHAELQRRLAELPTQKQLYDQTEIPLLSALADVEATGVCVDEELLVRISRELAERMQTLADTAYAAAGEAFNLGSPNQIKTILFDRLGLPVIRKTPKGAPSTAEDVLEELADQHELPRLIVDWRELSKLRSTYADKLPGQINPATGRIHTSYHQAVTATGRLSSSDPNLQNIPIRTESGRRIREAFVAPPGWQILAADYSQIELRIMAHLSGDPGLLAAFNDERDIHAATASEVFGVELVAVSADQRRAAKAINFGLMYGMSAHGLSRQLDVSRAEASAYIERFFERFAGVSRYMENTRTQAKAQGYVETLFGRRLYLPEISARQATRRQAAERAAINAPLQGTAADLIKKAMLAVHADTELAARMVMQVHDELVFEVPADEADDCARRITSLMANIAQLDVALIAETGIAANWQQAH
ncbi:DNA polymerase I [Salinisphaera sp. USBA-960]|nr:DNA polymerase I [Salifodinibacter halophilus]NNC27062.1 DNA polymerase I [Salifodinibacter halophilus]